MHNGIVATICRFLAESGIAAFRFNFRGIGGSEGDYGEGIGEQDDARAALDFVSSAPDIDVSHIGLAGYSFGGRIAAAVAPKDSRVKLLALVSPALTPETARRLNDFTAPKLIIVGDRDDTISSEDVESVFNTLPEPKQLKMVPGADHFWRDHEIEVGKAVASFAAQYFLRE